MTAPVHRVYFALWPDESSRAALAAAAAPVAAGCAGRAVLAEHLHLTLAFVGSVAPAVLGALARLGAALSWPTVTLRFGAVEWWPSARALVILVEHPPAALLEAHAALRSRLAAHGFGGDARPFRVHVTIARDVRHAPPECAVGVEWTAGRVALVESQPLPGGSCYRPLALFEPHASSVGFHVN